jgi:hypothetical protein
VLPASSHTISERNRRIKAALSGRNVSISKDNQATSPMSGNWTSKRGDFVDANPAGIRIPTDFKKR